MTTILHISTFSVLATRFMGFLACLIEHNYDRPDALLITGVTKRGTANELTLARVWLGALIHSLKLTMTRVIILPTPDDLCGGVPNFNTLFEPIKGRPYRIQDTQFLCFNDGIQLLGLGAGQTIRPARCPTFPINRVRPQALKLIAYATPFTQSGHAAALKAMRENKVNVGLSGEQSFWSSTPFYKEIGTGSGHFTALRCFQDVITRAHFECRNGHWRRTALHDIDLPRKRDQSIRSR